MKQTLQLKIGQHLTMTPQLQQAIKLLQLSTLELQNEIQEALDSNPLLEADDTNNGEDSHQDEAETDSSTVEEQNNDSYSEQEQTNTKESIDLDQKNELPDDLPVDSVWDDVYQSSPTPGPSSSSHDDEGWGMEERNGTETSLTDYLLWQLNLSPLSEVDKAIGETIIESLNPHGYLTLSIDDIAETVTRDQAHNLSVGEIIENDEVIAVLHFVQQFDPIGVAARDLKECLTVQLKHLPDETLWKQEALNLVENYIHLLGQRDFNQIMRKTKLREPQLKSVMTLIRTLHPQPGLTIDSDNTEYVTPDVYVKKINGRWLVELNPDSTPKLHINQHYASMAKNSRNSRDGSYIKNHMQEAKWFIKSLQSRNETLLKVATKIVEFQRGFFEYGPEAMKPLVLHDIAEAVEMHESTISRVTTQKFIHTPMGIFELKYFFSSHVSTTTGGECSSTAIRAIIKKLIADENPKKPFSDSKIAQQLGEQQIQVARRTVAKYRESMNIPPSNERKRLM